MMRETVRNRMWIIALALVLIACLSPDGALACAVCGTGPGIQDDPAARGFYWGILFLMAMPFAVAGSIGAWLIYRYWRVHGFQRRLGAFGLHVRTSEERGH
jgi:hypothetical protein